MTLNEFKNWDFSSRLIFSVGVLLIILVIQDIGSVLMGASSIFIVWGSRRDFIRNIGKVESSEN